MRVFVGPKFVEDATASSLGNYAVVRRGFSNAYGFREAWYI